MFVCEIPNSIVPKLFQVCCPKICAQCFFFCCPPTGLTSAPFPRPSRSPQVNKSEKVEPPRKHCHKMSHQINKINTKFMTQITSVPMFLDLIMYQKMYIW